MGGWGRMRRFCARCRCRGGSRLKGVTVCTVGSEPWRGSLSDRILIAENRWRRFLRFNRVTGL